MRPSPRLPREYRTFVRTLKRDVPRDRIVTDPLRTLTFGTDASFYRLVPKVVVTVETEDEVRAVLAAARPARLPVTFRAAGTSLSGQAVGAGVLVRLGRGWSSHEILDGGARVRLGPGVVGAQANRWLAPLGRKLGPDPASIDTAMVGGILANNASGMCCGVAQNSYHTLDSVRVVLADGTVLDTGCPDSRGAFMESHGRLLEGLADLHGRVHTDQELAARIRHKFRIKNTTGYSLNALVDFHDPVDILQHLLVGSEGTLGFVSSAVYRTVPEHGHKASALVTFPDVRTACRAIPVLADGPVAAAELMDRASLRAVEGAAGMPEWLAGLPGAATALLVETRAGDPDELAAQIAEIERSLASFETLRPIAFMADPEECGRLWKIRKGLFPAVGAVRRVGTTVVIEDVAFPRERLADAALELQALFERFGYDEAIIFGHALDGNLHFVFTQDFSAPEEVSRYRAFMDAVVELVVDRHDGSLKAEHGTGRNMAPFVEHEWGPVAYGLMLRLKELFDPERILNPGVILGDDPEAHVKDLKPLPAAHELADTCIECGFCEPICPSRHITFSPRQRVVARRELSRRSAELQQVVAAGAGWRERRSHRKPLRKMAKAYRYPALDTCAADGLCAQRCPVGIDTGALTKALREEAHGPMAHRAADWTARHFEGVSRGVSGTLTTFDAVHRVVGTGAMSATSKAARAVSGGRMPSWNPALPRGVPRLKVATPEPGAERRVVYFAACASRAMGGPARADSVRTSLPDQTLSVLEKAGYAVVLPPGLDALCCGQAFESKGFREQADRKSAELEAALLEASEGGKLPILCDTSPCLARMRRVMDVRLKLYEPVEFVLRFVAQHLEFTPLDEKVAVHPTCSLRKMGLDGALVALAKACAREVVVPEDIACCGFAGDRGLSHPELNAAALHGLAEQVCGCESGYSNSRTCEIGLTLHGGIPYRSILHLVDAASRPAAECVGG